MSSFDYDSGVLRRSDSDHASSVPSQCPACQSSSVTTTAKKPDANSYWRCETCGEVWNVARRRAVRGGAGPWR